MGTLSKIRERQKQAMANLLGEPVITTAPNRTPEKTFAAMVDELFGEGEGDVDAPTLAAVRAPDAPHAPQPSTDRQPPEIVSEATMTDADFAGPAGSLWLPSAITPGGMVNVRWDLREPPQSKRLREVEISPWLSLMLAR